jgi:hypothetical protein
MQACAYRLSGNAHQKGVGVYVGADFSVLETLTVF